MSVNRGKQFEEVVKDSFQKVPNTSVIRLPDPVQGYLGYRNICDFIVYHKPHQYFIECKSVHGNIFPFSNITDNQWQGMLEQSKITGVVAGVLCWWIDKDKTVFMPIQTLELMKTAGVKSVRYDIVCDGDTHMIEIHGKKKRIFFDYDMWLFFNTVSFERALTEI